MPRRPRGNSKARAPAPAAPLVYPKELHKTLVAALFLLLSVWLRTQSLALTHERVPDSDPLPDVVLDNVQYQQWALDESDHCIMLSTSLVALLVVLHAHRCIVLRRICFLVGVLYFYKSITMYFTVLPISDPMYTCAPKENATTAFMIVKRVVTIISGGGLSINGKHVYCGDYIFSGHTMTLTIGYYAIRDYSPKRYRPLHWFSLAVSCLGVILLMLARGHYSIDVILAYWVTSRLWRMYHSMANTRALRRVGDHNLFSENWWFYFFVFFEENVPGPLPRQYNFPIPDVIFDYLPERLRFENNFE